jgi:hypothetical protein
MLIRNCLVQYSNYSPNLVLLKTKNFRSIKLSLIVLLFSIVVEAQQITGIWKGKVKSRNIELKLIKSGDSLTGVAYYYNTKNNFQHFSVKGYFDPETNAVIWWDDVPLDGKSSAEPLLTVADFNCPGEDKMLLEGNSSLRDNKEILKGALVLQKVNATQFPDEWDWVIENYTAGTNNPTIIDSIGQLVAGPRYFPEERLPDPVVVAVPAIKQSNPTVKELVTIVDKSTPAKKSSSNHEKFVSRKNKLQMVIPMAEGASIELRFYDNAAIDGDSIAIFLNGRLLREHILLGGEPQTIKLSSADLQDDNELVLVAENLGSIPPNTSYLVAVVGKKQYEARLFADEGTSALVRFVKEKAK